MKKYSMWQRLAASYRKQNPLAKNLIVANGIAVIASVGATFWALLTGTV